MDKVKIRHKDTMWEIKLHCKIYNVTVMGNKVALWDIKFNCEIKLQQGDIESQLQEITTFCHIYCKMCLCHIVKYRHD